MKGQCDIAKRKKSCKKSDSYVAKEHIKTRLKSVSKEDDRSKNLIVFGLHEENDEDLESKVSDMLECFSQSDLGLLYKNEQIFEQAFTFKVRGDTKNNTKTKKLLITKLCSQKLASNNIY